MKKHFFFWTTISLLLIFSIQPGHSETSTPSHSHLSPYAQNGFIFLHFKQNVNATIAQDTYFAKLFTRLELALSERNATPQLAENPTEEAKKLVAFIINWLSENQYLPRGVTLIEPRQTNLAYALASGVYDIQSLVINLLKYYRLIKSYREENAQWQLPWTYQKRLQYALPKLNRQFQSLFDQTFSLERVKYPRLFSVSSNFIYTSSATVDFFSDEIYIEAKTTDFLKTKWIKYLYLKRSVVHEHFHLLFPGFPDLIFNEGATEYFTSCVLNQKPVAYFKEVALIEKLIRIVGEELVKKIYQTGNIFLLEKPLGKEMFQKLIRGMRDQYQSPSQNYQSLLDRLNALLESKIDLPQQDLSFLHRSA